MAFGIKNDVLKYYVEEAGVTEVLIPEGVKRIEDWAFRGCSRITHVTIPESVTEMGKYAFSECRGLTNITFPKGLTEIGDYAFSGCRSLTHVTIPEGVRTIGDHAFSDCRSLTHVTISEGVRAIGDRAFSSCEKLQHLYISDQLMSLGAFTLKYQLPHVHMTIGENTFTFHNMYRSELSAILHMLHTKDFSTDLTETVKFKVNIALYLKTRDAKAEVWIRRHFQKLFTYFIKGNWCDIVEQILKTGSFVTRRNIDKYIDLAIEQKQYEIQTILMQYKHETIGYCNPVAQFKL